MNIKERILKIINEGIENVVSEIGYDGELPEVRLEYPKDAKFGDYSTPFSLEAAKFLHKAPLQIGESLVKQIQDNDLFAKVEVVKPGFINMYLSSRYYITVLEEVLAKKDEYGKTVKENPLRYNIEFVSANPTGPLNVVSARAAALGDTLANIITTSGDIADREFYVNDYGNQVYLLGKSVLSRYRELSGVDTVFPEDGYHGSYVKDIAVYLKEQKKTEIEKIQDEEELITYFSKEAVAYNLAGQQRDMKDFKVEYQKWFSERTLHESNEVMKTLQLLDQKDLIFEEEGKKFFKATEFGDDKDRVVVRDDGRPTYLLADITYHRTKVERNYDRIVDIWGPDHHGYIARLAGAMIALGYPKEHFTVLIAQQVNLVMNGEIVKMSKRLGNFSTMRELIDEIGVDVSRYFFSMRSADSHLDFDLALAKKTSSENPVFYLQYAYARICSIFRKVKDNNLAYDFEKVNSELLANEEAQTLMKLIAKFPEEISACAASLEVHHLCNYLMKLAQCYHKFYTEHRVICDDQDALNANLFISEAVRIVLHNGLNLIGVSSPEKM